MDLDARTAIVGGTTLVALRLTNPGDSVRVRVANRLDGPVWPPRTNGVPDAGWDDGGWEGVVPGGGRALGYATPAADDRDEAVDVVWTEPAAHGEEARDERATGEDVVRALGDPRPPRDALPDVASLPEDVEGWLAAVTARASSGDAEPGDREALRRVAARARTALDGEPAGSGGER